MRIALATCAQLPSGDADDQPLFDACAVANFMPSWARWDDPSVHWQDFDRVLIRSTWDYTARRAEFLDWARSVAGQTRLVNPAELVVWNSDKTYLRDIEQMGLPIVPTDWVPVGGVAPVDSLAGPDVVVKPTVGAGSMGVGRFRSDATAASAHVHTLHDAGRTAMVQPYLPAVDQAGETALLFFGGRFSHAIRKAPLLQDVRGAQPLRRSSESPPSPTDRIEPRTPSAAELELASELVAAIATRADAAGHRRPDYVRVDLLPGPDGPVIIEVELIEPSLFLRHAPDPAAAAQQMIAALVDA